MRKRFPRLSGFLLIAVCLLPGAVRSHAQEMPELAQRLLADHNRYRTQHGLGKLEWDPALAKAALLHCYQMAGHNDLSHQYAGEPDLSARAGAAGAQFGLIEENIAAGTDFEPLFPGWLHSPAHFANLTNPDINRVGIAVVQRRGWYYAVVDFSRGTVAMGSASTESRIASLIAQHGVAIRRNNTLAQQACRTNSGMPEDPHGDDPRFVMRWQNTDLDHLPDALISRLRSGRYSQAEVASCPAAEQNGFTVYRLAVLLY